MVLRNSMPLDTHRTAVPSSSHTHIIFPYPTTSHPSSYRLELIRPYMRGKKTRDAKSIVFAAYPPCCLFRMKNACEPRAGGYQVLSMISSNTVERQIRGDFVLRCNISSERARADEICASSELSPVANGDGHADCEDFTLSLAVCCVWILSAKKQT